MRFTNELIWNVDSQALSQPTEAEFSGQETDPLC